MLNCFSMAAGANEKLQISARIQIERVALDHEVDGEIALS